MAALCHRAPREDLNVRLAMDVDCDLGGKLGRVYR